MYAEVSTSPIPATRYRQSGDDLFKHSTPECLSEGGRGAASELRVQVSSRWNRSKETPLSTHYSAREPLEIGMLREILTCVQRSPVAQLYTALINMSSGDETSINLTGIPVRLKQQSNVTSADQPLLAYQHSDEPFVVSAAAGTTSITQGVILNGQCLCSCPESRHRPVTTSTRTDPLVAASTDYLSKIDALYTIHNGGITMFRSQI